MDHAFRSLLNPFRVRIGRPTKLIAVQVEEARTELAAGNATFASLAERYRVASRALSHAIGR